MLSTLPKTNLNSIATFILSSANALNLNHSKNLSFGKELTHYQTTNFRLSQTERFCRRQFQTSRKWQKLSNWVENTVGKGEIFRYEQFLLFPRCFQKASLAGASKGVIMWEWVKPQNISPLVYRDLYNACFFFFSLQCFAGVGDQSRCSCSKS